MTKHENPQPSISPFSNPIVLDFACKEGQNVLFFARNGYQATDIEISNSGIKKVQELTQHWNVQAEFIRAPIAYYHPNQNFNIERPNTLSLAFR